MVSVRKRKMAKSSVKKVSRRNKNQQRKVNIACNPIIEKNWDYNLTLAQNYRNLGLRAKLGKSAGGVEANLNNVVLKKAICKPRFNDGDSDEEQEEGAGELDTEGEFDENKILEGEARIHRSKDGTVIKVVYGKMRKIDVDADISDIKKELEGIEEQNPVVEQLIEFSKRPVAKKERVQSSREDAWLERLYAKYGDDCKKMSRDSKLNIYQQSAGDLFRRINKWKKAHGIA